MPTPLEPISHDRATDVDRPIGRRAAVLGGLLLLPPCVAWWSAPLLGIGGGVRGVLALSFPVVLIVGYQLWWIRIMAAATGTIGGRLMRALGKGRKHSKQERVGLRPTAAEVRQLNQRALDVSSVFRTVARTIAVVVGVAVGLGVDWWAALFATLALIAWGQWLAALGAQNWLPIPEADD